MKIPQVDHKDTCITSLFSGQTFKYRGFDFTILAVVDSQIEQGVPSVQINYQYHGAKHHLLYKFNRPKGKLLYILDHTLHRIVPYQTTKDPLLNDPSSFFDFIEVTSQQKYDRHIGNLE